MSDDIDPSTQIRRSRSTEANSSNGTLTIVLAVVAVVIGFLILRSLNAPSNAAGSGGVATVPTTLVPVDTPPVPTATLAPTIDFAGATILVANANGTPGSAGKMSDQLKAAGATVATPGNATSKLDVSQILYDANVPDALKVATSLSHSLSPPGPAPTPLVPPPPIDTDLQGATVILLLGNDLATATVSVPVQPPTTLTIAPTVPTTLAPPAG